MDLLQHLHGGVEGEAIHGLLVNKKKYHEF